MLQQYETFIEENQTVYNYTEENGEIKPSAVFISFTEEFPLVLISKYKNEIPLSDFLYENKSKQLKFKKIQQINYISSEEGAAALYGSRGAAGVYTLIVK